MATSGTGNDDPFRKALLHISHQLSEENITKLKQELSDLIYEDKQYGFQIFEQMIRKGKLEQSKGMDSLILLLRKINRTDLAKILQEWNGNEEIPCRCNRHNADLSQKEFLDECGKSIKLSKRQLSDDGIVLKLSLVKSDMQVENVYLSGNSVGVRTLQCLLTEDFHHAKNLYLRSCKLGKPELIDQLKEVMTKLLNLELVDLYENNLADRGFETLIPCFIHLKKIICGKNKITTKGLEALSRKLKEETITLIQMKSLSLASNKIDKNSIYALQEILARSPNLEEFDIAQNILGCSAPEIIKCLPKSLKKLSLKDCKLVHTSKDSLTSTLQTLPNLVSLDLGANDLGVACTDIVTPLLQKNKQFEELRLYNCKIMSDGMIALSRPLSQLRYLTVLTLSKNHIQTTGAKALSEALPYLNELTELWLSDNELHDDGLISLVPALENLVKLNTLALNNNAISDRGAMELAKPLQGFYSLQEFYLYDNMISDCGIIAILKSLMIMNDPGVTKLAFNSNMIGEIGINYLSLNISKMKNLKEVSLGNNSFSEDHKPKLEKLSKKLGINITL